jgi:hypothetical protein
MNTELFIPKEQFDWIFEIYGLPPGALDGCQFILADLDSQESLECVFVKDGKIFHQTDSHCSCNGFEEWAPTETDAEALKKYWLFHRDEKMLAKIDALATHMKAQINT